MADFSMSRSTTINAPSDRIHSHLDDFHEWPQWSPWEGLDPDMERTYTGPEKGVGSHYAWAGNKKAGEGTMEITGSTPSRIEIALGFLKPFKASNVTVFELAPAGAGATRVTWHMTGRRNPIMAIAGKLFFDKAIAKDFDRGLARLKTVSEAR
ncbi:SRPBCC family protein [Nocardioides currus]|uniref:Transcriptional regulator n=1 Tax=Nocardioides currus TaxID=2133958 RepID=A0A2R7YYB2_9ACTN|nr:SRPBCC family protein [Nocardioides currus]PUA80869.1 transcriptional regulator [Nocardioides currus]